LAYPLLVFDRAKQTAQVRQSPDKVARNRFTAGSSVSPEETLKPETVLTTGRLRLHAGRKRVLAGSRRLPRRAASPRGIASTAPQPIRRHVKERSRSPGLRYLVVAKPLEACADLCLHVEFSRAVRTFHARAAAIASPSATD
jgi:hypothetical protein